MPDARPERLGVLYDTSIEKQWHQLLGEVRRCQHLLKGLASVETIFLRFKDWNDVLKYLRKTGWRDPQFDIVVHHIIEEAQSKPSERWHVILILIFWPTLKSVLKRSFGFDPDKDNLWMNIVWAFIESTHKIALYKKTKHLASRIYYDTFHSVYGMYSRTWKRDAIAKLSNSKEMRKLIKRIRSYDPKHIDFEIDKQNLLRRLKRYLSQGLIAELDYHLIVGTEIYHKSVKDCSQELGVNYEFAKKHRQRAMKKIQES